MAATYPSMTNSTILILSYCAARSVPVPSIQQDCSQQHRATLDRRQQGEAPFCLRRSFGFGAFHMGKVRREDAKADHQLQSFKIQNGLSLDFSSRLLDVH
jgi:hypothetical protein